MLQPKKTKYRKAHKGRIRGKAKGGALAIRKPEEKTAGVSKPKAKEGFNKSQPPKPNRPQPTVTKKAQPAPALAAEKEKERKEKEKEKRDRKKLDLKKPLGAVAGVAKDAAGRILKTDTRAKVDTYEAQ